MRGHWLWLVVMIVGVGFVHPAGAAPARDTDIVAWDAQTLRAELAAGRVAAERVTAVFLARIAALDAAGPKLGSVIEINPDALAIARRLDRQRERGGLGPLHGVPVLIKASIDTADRMATSAGSKALAAHRAQADAEIVARLRAAGAVVLGKTNMSEWANFRSSASTSGWSSLGGQTRNPYVLDRNPCGSSSGSAVAVAAHLAPLAVGTETDGSIVCPAAANGVVGIKPSAGSVSRRGIVPIASSQDVAGPLARTVADAALLLAVLSGSPEFVVPTESLAGARVGVVRNYRGAGADASVEQNLSAALALLRGLGAELVDPVNPPPPPQGAELTLLLAEFHDDIDRYLATVAAGPRTLDELIAYDDAHAAEVMPYFGQEWFLAARATGGRADEPYREAVTGTAAARSALEDEFARRDLDVLVAPANARAWRTDLGKGDVIRVNSSSIAAVSGYPSVVVPFGMDGELPLGIAFIGRPGAEARLLEIAAAVEHRRGAFPGPKFLATVGE